MKKINLALLAIIVLVGITYMLSCHKTTVIKNDTSGFAAKLSAYNIYNGPGSLAHAANYQLYELATPLFSDHAEKQRLISIPAGTKIKVVNNGLPEFPDSTIIVKTFFYYLDKAGTGKGKKIIETRLLIKHSDKWNAATYLWNKDQTDAALLSAGADIPMNWIDEDGKPQVISYRVPSIVECGMCHQSQGALTLIGPKVRNLNFDITINGANVNQLTHLQNQGLFEPVDPAAHASLPGWENPAFSFAERARAYMDVNCGHCHNHGGLARRSSLNLAYETPLEESQIKHKKKAIGILMLSGAMPLIGTTVVDEKGLRLVQEYLKTIE